MSGGLRRDKEYYHFFLYLRHNKANYILNLIISPFLTWVICSGKAQAANKAEPQSTV